MENDTRILLIVTLPNTANIAGKSVLFKDTSRPICRQDRSVDNYTNRLLET